jgi:hypothetical protein
MLSWRDLGSVGDLNTPPSRPPPKSGARAGGRRLSAHAEAVTAILSRQIGEAAE